MLQTDVSTANYVASNTVTVVVMVAAAVVAVWLSWVSWSRFFASAERLRERQWEAERPPAASGERVDGSFDVRVSNARLPWPRPRRLVLSDGWLAFTVPGRSRPTLQVAADRLWMQIDEKDRLLIYGPSITRITISGVANLPGALGSRTFDDSSLVATLSAKGVRVPLGSRPRLPDSPKAKPVSPTVPGRGGPSWPWTRRGSR